jgi:hypothetical protein
MHWQDLDLLFTEDTDVAAFVCLFTNYMIWFICIFYLDLNLVCCQLELLNSITPTVLYTYEYNLTTLAPSYVLFQPLYMHVLKFLFMYASIVDIFVLSMNFELAYVHCNLKVYRVDMCLYYFSTLIPSPKILILPLTSHQIQV